MDQHTPDRSGRPGDPDNMVMLVKEMRANFCSSFGIGMAIPASYRYLRWFKPRALEPYVDFYGVMTYYMHGPWDENIGKIGAAL